MTFGLVSLVNSKSNFVGYFNTESVLLEGFGCLLFGAYKILLFI